MNHTEQMQGCVLKNNIVEFFELTINHLINIKRYHLRNI